MTGRMPDPPTQLQSLLLRAVTLPAEQAVEAWRRWAAEVAVDDLEPDSQWLLPLLFVRLRAAEVSSDAIERYANVFRHNWYTSHVRLNALRLVLDGLRAFGHEPVVLGPVSMAVAFYPVLGARPFGSLTLAAPRNLTADQISSVERCLPVEVGTVLRWQTARRPIATQEVSVVRLTLDVPEAADAMIHVLTGAATGPHDDDVSELLWAVDAVTVARRLNRNGWATVWRIAAEQGLTANVEAHLEWLRAVGLPVDRSAAA